ncbi:MAG: TIGR00730 family Rossman fold protein [Thermoanaerobaculales bacterium]|nr:TIGR00730 family Rossman fold protein [Thermoanaerobaculales bacterium]
MNRICVFCGSSPGTRPEYLQAAEALGRECVRRDLGLVYGGASVGLMGRLAETVLTSGGNVIGVIPFSLVEREVALSDLSDLRVVGSMHERKALMAELSDGFVALPGGLGTIEEFFEVLTWTQLGIHEKPCGLLNVSGYFDSLVEFLDHAVEQQFIRPENRSMVLVDKDPRPLLDMFESYEQPTFDKAEWILSMSNRIGA